MSTHWQAALKTHWEIEGNLSKLDGEYDLNFLVEGSKDYVLKVMRAGCESSFIDMQCKAINHLTSKASNLPIPQIIPTTKGELYTEIEDETGASRLVWLLEKAEGCTYAAFKPKSDQLIYQLGHALGNMDATFKDFHHPELQRDFKWNLSQGDWVTQELDILTSSSRRSLIEDITAEYSLIKDELAQLEQVAIHNDLNDYNILVNGSLNTTAYVTGLIDFGDMCASPRICDLAICAAYIVLDHPKPVNALITLVSGYNSAYALNSRELDMLWPLLRLRLAVSVVNSTKMAKENPDDPYIVISQKPAWDFLEKNAVDQHLIASQLKAACGLEISENAREIKDWLNKRAGNFSPVLGISLENAEMLSLSVEDSTLPQNPFDFTEEEAATPVCPDDKIMLGHYAEPRLIYTDKAFFEGPYKASDRRTVHLGVDIFAPAATDVHAPMAATVHSTEIRADNLDYGGVIVLRHVTDTGAEFFTLYGHLDPASTTALEIGQEIAEGQAFAKLGDPSGNGGWPPHLHFQLGLNVGDMECDWPGVALPDDMYFWGEVFPNPAPLLNLHDEKTRYMPTSKADILKARKEHFSSNLKLTYDDPVMFLRGWKHHLFDEWGRPYLDSYNNVPHVGHAHPRIQAVAADQLKRMNSNTRYLHPAQKAFAEKIISKMPEGLNVCFFVNSGTEANELALRLARAASGGKDMITPDHGYHGNTTGCIDISAYKFNAKGGVGQSDWVHLIEVADDYRGSFKRGEKDVAEKYASLVDEALDKIETRGGKLAGFIAETFPSVGGQIIPPKGYLPKVYDRIRKAGGICIADEVQTGLGRLGDYYFAFEHQGAVPDIVVMGKPIGNGHPLGVLVTTREIADKFAEGPEYFSTFGGSNLSCRMGKEVLDIVDEEGLMENASLMGARLKEGLEALQEKYQIIGDVRGIGLFLGLDLVEDRTSRKEGSAIASYVKNRMRENRILMGSEGPKDNILKIRPPITIQADDVDMILNVMDQVLEEAEFLNKLSGA